MSTFTEMSQLTADELYEFNAAIDMYIEEQNRARGDK